MCSSDLVVYVAVNLKYRRAVQFVSFQCRKHNIMIGADIGDDIFNFALSVRMSDFFFILDVYNRQKVPR